MSFYIIVVVDNFNGKFTILYATVFLKMDSVTAIGYENNDKKRSTKVTISSLKYNFIHIQCSLDIPPLFSGGPSLIATDSPGPLFKKLHCFYVKCSLVITPPSLTAKDYAWSQRWRYNEGALYIYTCL